MLLLVIEDTPEDQFLLRHIFERAGHAVVLRGDPISAYAALMRFDFDACVVDFNLPLVNGLELLERLRENAPSLPIILCSGVEDLEKGIVLKDQQRLLSELAKIQ